MDAHKLVTSLATPKRLTPSASLATCLLASTPTLQLPLQLAWSKALPLTATRSQLPRGTNFTTWSTKCGWRGASAVTKDVTIMFSLEVQPHFPSASYSHIHFCVFHHMLFSIHWSSHNFFIFKNDAILKFCVTGECGGNATSFSVLFMLSLKAVFTLFNTQFVKQWTKYRLHVLYVLTLLVGYSIFDATSSCHLKE